MASKPYSEGQRSKKSKTSSRAKDRQTEAAEKKRPD